MTCTWKKAASTAPSWGSFEERAVTLSRKAVRFPLECIGLELPCSLQLWEVQVWCNPTTTRNTMQTTRYVLRGKASVSSAQILQVWISTDRRFFPSLQWLFQKSHERMSLINRWLGRLSSCMVGYFGVWGGDWIQSIPAKGATKNIDLSGVSPCSPGMGCDTMKEARKKWPGCQHICKETNE